MHITLFFELFEIIWGLTPCDLYIRLPKIVMLKSILIQFLWLIGIFLLTQLLIWIFLGNSPFDLHIHDTYFILGGSMRYLFHFLLLSFLVFFFKELPKKFSRRIPNVFMIGSGLGFFLLVFYLVIAILK